MPQPPSELFHYTSTEGLLGIIESHSLWATDFRFLNDEQEVIFARQALVDALQAIGNPAEDAAHQFHADQELFGAAFLEYVDSVGQHLEDLRYPTFVSSFCAAGDLLSQWRGYGQGDKYAVGFDAAWLRKVGQRAGEPGADPAVASSRSGLIQVRYGTDAASELVGPIIEELRQVTNIGFPGVKSYLWSHKLVRALAGIKSDSWREEQEWRVLRSNDDDGEGFDLSFRVDHHGLGVIPYAILPFPIEALTSVRVGPGPNRSLRQTGVESLLQRNGMSSEVFVSAASYRGS